MVAPVPSTHTTLSLAAVAPIRAWAPVFYSCFYNISYSKEVVSLLDILFPRRCAGCNQIGAYLCSQCLNKLKTINHAICPACGHGSFLGKTHPSCRSKTALDGLVSLFPYHGLAKHLITKLKYKFVTDVSDTLIELCISSGELEAFPQPPTLISVPLHSSRLKWRGFNQADLLAQELAKACHWQFLPNALTRTRATTAQMTLSGAKRRQNLHHAFALSNPDQLKNKHLVLVDDVWTTGTTMAECAKALKKAYPASIWAFTLARAKP